jgi:hypothetical protein
LFRLALHKFLRRTQKIMKSVEPAAQLVVPSKRTYKKKGKRKPASFDIKDVVKPQIVPAGVKQWQPTKEIEVPQFYGKGLFQLEISSAAISEDSCSDENTDDETYAGFHGPREKVEEIYFRKLDVGKAKRNSKGTPDTASLEAGLEMLRRYLPPSTAAEYDREGCDLLPWPWS